MWGNKTLPFDIILKGRNTAPVINLPTESKVGSVRKDSAP